MMYLNNMNQFMDGNIGYSFGWLINIFWLVLIITAIFAIGFWIIKQKKSGYISDNQNKSAIDILKERYAKGEITKEEFDKIKIDL